jgi:hypothetical protein
MRERRDPCDRHLAGSQVVVAFCFAGAGSDPPISSSTIDSVGIASRAGLFT